MSDKIYNNLKQLFDRKNFEDFEQEFSKIRNLNNHLTDKVYNLFGVYLVLKKQFTEAKDYFEKSISLNNSFNEPKVNLALLLINLKEDINKAEALLNDAFLIDQKNNRIFHILFDFNFGKNNFEKCIKYGEDYIHEDTTDSYAYNKLGVAYFRLFNFKKAIENFKLASQLNSENFEFSFNLYRCYKAEKDIKKSKEILNYLKLKFPNNKKVLYELANLSRGLGEFEKSNFYLETIIKDSFVANYNAVYQLFLSPKYQQQEELFKNIEPIFSAQSKSFQEIVGYGIFKYLDRKKDFFKAAKYLKNSLKLSSERLNYNLENEKYYFKFFKEMFNENFFLKYKLNRINNPLNVKQIFIVGLHRSGSTLVEQILSTQKNISPHGEVTFFPDLITKYFPNQEIETFKSDIKKFNDKQFLAIGKDYLNRVNTSNEQIVLDKQLSNFRLLGLIFLCLPNSLIINIKRSKKDHLFSILSNYYAGDHAPWSYDVGNLIEYYNLYEDLMFHWQKIFPEQIVNIHYEKVISNPKEEMLKILKKINMDWNKSFLDFNKSKNLVETQSAFQVREKLYDNSIDRWKAYKDYFPSLFK